MKFRLLSAKEVGVEPHLIKGYEKHGKVYFLWHDSGAVGAQCSSCHTIVWTDGRLNKILTQTKPSDIPPSGNKYRQYHLAKISNFLNSLPNCPKCHANRYDLFINNVNYPRFADGTPFPADNSNVEPIKLDPTETNVWWVEECS